MAVVKQCFLCGGDIVPCDGFVEQPRQAWALHHGHLPFHANCYTYFESPYYGPGFALQQRVIAIPAYKAMLEQQVEQERLYQAELAKLVALLQDREDGKS